MMLRGWSWEAAIGPAGLGDRPLLEALEAAIPDEAVEAAIEAAGTQAAFLGGLRLMAIDGTTIDVADTPENDRAFGRPTTKRGAGAFPQIRVLALIETGTHVICDAVIRPFGTGEVPTALRLLRSVGPGMLLLWDRGFHSYEMVRV